MGPDKTINKLHFEDADIKLIEFKYQRIYSNSVPLNPTNVDPSFVAQLLFKQKNPRIPHHRAYNQG